MKVQYLHKIFLVLIITLGWISTTQVVFAGFGITPPYVRNDTLTRGSEFTQKILLVRGDPIEDLKGEISFDLPNISDWVVVDKGLEFILPAGEKQVPIQVTVRVPEDAKYGNYKGHIRVRTSAVGGPEAGSVSIALGAQIDVDLRVVDQIVDFEVKRVELSELEEGYTKWWLDYPGRISFSMHIKNTGNIDVAPSKVIFDIYDRKGETLLETVESNNDIERVAPFATERVTAHLPTKLKAGGYLVKFRVYKNEDIAREGELTLSVLPHGTVPGYIPYGIAGVSFQGANIITPILSIFEGLSVGDKLSIIIPLVVFVMVLIVGVLYFRGSFTHVATANAPSRRPVAPQAPFESTSAPRRPVAPVQPRTPVRAHGNVLDLTRK